MSEKHATDAYYKPYDGPAGGWGALKSTQHFWLSSGNATRNVRTLLNTNQPHGFDCPGCAWGEQHKPGMVRFCENGAKAVNWEATGRTVDAAFFAKHSVSALYAQSDYFLEYQGRLTEPMRYNPNTDHYEPIAWDDAFALIGETLRGLDSPDQVEFYTSGRASNEAAFLYQLFARAYGTNNFPDCSNMCHEASGYGLISSIGIGKGTVSIDDFEQADAVFVFGQNPGTNHPRMLDTLRDVIKHGKQVLCFNTLKERGLERFQHPQNPLEMLTNGFTPLNTAYFTPKLGGDMAAVRGIVKVLIALEEEAQQRGEQVFDHAFIAEHTQGMDDYLAQVKATSWEKILEQSGLTREEIVSAAQVYAKADSVICTWAMGVTQHKHSVPTVHEIVNLLLLRGNLGKPGAGACPVRGHSNVQGDRTMGINEKPAAALLDKLAERFGFEPPRNHGHAVVPAIHAMLEGKSRVFIGLGGNFAAATPDTPATEQALRNCDLTVQISTKLNRSHLVTGKNALILPCLGRTDIDMQATGSQHVTVEDSFSMVHASSGVLEPLSLEMRSEPAIIAGMAKATLGNHPVNWMELIEDYDRIRDLIAEVIPGFTDFNQQIAQPGGFYLGNSAREHRWNTPASKAIMHSHELPRHILHDAAAEHLTDATLIMQTLRSHDQYNTTIYGLNDRYRGIKNERKVVFINPADLERLGFSEGQEVSIRSVWNDGQERRVDGFKLVPYSIPAGNVAAYYPETNPLVPLTSVGDYSNTPTSKSIAVVLEPHQSARIA
ncbi:FdhF/YdeP family oxidoreductase [Azomonas macrocytogenes]|uniref:Molybdopterin-dependent oxidoreductase alpha subunit n=1 Tax=Azomonas macrocytogenes TaxID=69962 RepID=A0A839T0B2_AZOMA|nr:FdhF/YdeP family oxidoreductase [Azomonas macrocytogenes]MBB3101960.1 molybdopterin-dependent oxidoreductase alpha subunit [Azomonas macrocytogenes]